MNLFSVTFIAFFILVLLLLWQAKTVKIQQYLLLLASYIFYGFWDWRFLSLLTLTSFIIFQTAKFVRVSRLARLFGVGMPLLFLGICKYLNFFRETLYTLLGVQSVGALDIILPLGISFYTFLALSYLLDVYFGRIAVEENYCVVALYVSFFPTVISGPITKARDLLPQFYEYKRIKWNNLQAGAQIFIIGCLKKFVLADYIGVFVDDVYHAPLAFDSATVWLAVIGYSLQLYLDFAGYSDMAIGCARCMDFRLCENFNLPYLAKNISEFWKRWHISLSSWLMEYLYIALGGSRCGTIKIFRNLLFTMLICGLWHGAAWNFILWGGVHGLLLCLHRLYRDSVGRLVKLPYIFCILLTNLVATLCWVFFRGADIQSIYEIYYRLFVWETFGVNQMYVYVFIAIVLLTLVSIVAVFKYNGQAIEPVMDITKPSCFFVFCMEIFVLIGLMYTGNNPFAYAAF